ADVDDVGVSRRQERRQESPRQLQRAVQIEGEDTIPLFVGHRLSFSVIGDARVIDQNVQAAPRLEQFIGSAASGGRADQVAGYGQNAHAETLCLERDVRQTVFVDVQQIKVRTFTRQG